ncbi:HET-domain-containing protein [Tothia fuscella]|uniref:HET-domain-containing protein n=1 Tax=Tothia fuscella TaxID=1048955 RepID=A0A9P4NFM1_9PEZI|nr:HET-domain-containing protein [Tothia fuscella]
MRLLQYKPDSDGFELVTFRTNDLPSYAILSHTWTAGQEVTYDELRAGIGKGKAGYAKIRFCGERAAHDSLQYFWVDTCCINKSNPAELQEAIASMFYWYRRAVKCYVYLADVIIENTRAQNIWKSKSIIWKSIWNNQIPVPKEPQEPVWKQAFRKSRWFTRGWTLQELLAPASVEFFSREGRQLGDKLSLEEEIHLITGLPRIALQGGHLSQFSVTERFRWVELRKTRYDEDLAYSLLGIFNVDLPLRYGEGKVNAFERLENEIYKLEKCIQDLHLTDPRDDKKRIEKAKGGLLRDAYRWILENPNFQQWRSDQESRLLWINGDTGKGKTMLLCGIINELSKSIAKTALLSYFFCQATNSQIDNATAVLRGLIYMLVKQQPSLASHLRTKYDHTGKAIFEDANAWIALSEILTNILQDPRLDSAYILIDALDECLVDLPELLTFVVNVSSQSPCVKWIVSGRNWPSIARDLDTVTQKVRLCLELNAQSISAAVATFIQFQVNWLTKRNEYGSDVQDAVYQHLLLNANGTFLFVALVCKELADVSEWDAEEVVRAFPPGLDSLYKRMLDQFYNLKHTELCKSILATVLTVLRPITLDELPSLVDMPPRSSRNYKALEEIIRLCGSFLIVQERIISIVHQSAKDYLLKEASDEIFPAGLAEMHYSIMSKSLRTLSPTLQRDMYSLRALGYPIDKVKKPESDPLAKSRYACVFWIDHLSDWFTKSGADPYHGDLQAGGTVEVFIKEKYLYWLEALSLCKSMSEGVVSVEKLEALLKVRADAPELLKLVHDARRFILYHKVAIENNPLQAYASALMFSPTSSLIRKLFRHEEPAWITIRPAIGDEWSACLATGKF